MLLMTLTLGVAAIDDKRSGATRRTRTRSGEPALRFSGDERPAQATAGRDAAGRGSVRAESMAACRSARNALASSSTLGSRERVAQPSRGLVAACNAPAIAPYVLPRP